MAAAEASEEYDHEIEPDAMYWQDDVLMYEDSTLSQGDDVYLWTTDNSGEKESLVRIYDVEGTGDDGSPAIFIETEQLSEEELGHLALETPNETRLVDFKVRSQTLEVSSDVDPKMVSNTEDTDLTSKVTFDVDSNRTAYDLWITDKNGKLDQEGLEQLFGDQGRIVKNDANVAMINENGNEVYGVEVTSEDKEIEANFANMKTGEYNMRFYVEDSGVSKETELTVLDAKNRSVDLNANEYSTEIGESITIKLYFENYYESYLRIHSDDKSYSARVMLTDYDNPREVSVEFDTKSGEFELIGDQDNVELIDQTKDKSGPSTGGYTVSAGLDNKEYAFAPFTINGHLKTLNYEFVDESGDPVEVTMTLDGETKTGSEIQYVVAPDREYRYTIEADGYYSIGGLIPVDSNINDIITMEKLPVEYTVNVTNNSGNPVEGATVTLGENESTTNESGSAEFSVESDQDYTLTVSGPNITSHSETVRPKGTSGQTTVTVTQQYEYTVNLKNQKGEKMSGKLDINGREHVIENGSVTVKLDEGEHTGKVYVDTGDSSELVRTLNEDLQEDKEVTVEVDTTESDDQEDSDQDDSDMEKDEDKGLLQRLISSISDFLSDLF